MRVAIQHSNGMFFAGKRLMVKKAFAKYGGGGGLYAGRLNTNMHERRSFKDVLMEKDKNTVMRPTHVVKQPSVMVQEDLKVYIPKIGTKWLKRSIIGTVRVGVCTSQIREGIADFDIKARVRKAVGLTFEDHRRMDTALAESFLLLKEWCVTVFFEYGKILVKVHSLKQIPMFSTIRVGNNNFTVHAKLVDIIIVSSRKDGRDVKGSDGGAQLVQEFAHGGNRYQYIQMLKPGNGQLDNEFVVIGD
ncbi:Uncharacterized protein TCM_038997 [Theobroma cacao]|uniref:Uncharacterized protein n=1 Tax=Theobroma cacao TaxID=3641 RepID=A0A061GQM1_THECC|nr:Uncharacterized protein TCM_038997 [Theobroma cacao]